MLTLSPSRLRFYRRACGVALVAIFVTAGTAWAKEPVPKKVTLESPDRLRVFHDGKGHYLVAPRPGLPKTAAVRKMMRRSVFFGDRKTLYRQRVSGSFRNGRELQLRVADPRSREPRFSMFFVRADGSAEFRCEKRKTGLTELSQPEARQFLKRAVFRDVYWKHVAHLLARDGDGRYFYVDRYPVKGGGVEPLGGSRGVVYRGLRLWIGKRGKMQRVKLKDSVSDPAGQILISNHGKLIVTAVNRKISKVAWQARASRGKCVSRRTSLTIVPISSMNGAMQMIYFDLGPYVGVRLQKPCDVW